MKKLFTLIAATLVALPVAASEIGDDGLHKADWMRDTFKDMAEDLAEANDEGKRLLLMVEQRGCIYCKKMHEEVLSQDDVSAYIEENFFVVQMNLHGSTEVTEAGGQDTFFVDSIRRQVPREFADPGCCWSGSGCC